MKRAQRIFKNGGSAVHLRGQGGEASPAVPFALPAPLGHGLQRRGEAVGVVAYVTVITEQESSGVTRLPTGLTHGALQAPPTFAKNDFSDL